MDIESFIQSNPDDLDDDSKEEIFNIFVDTQIDEVPRKNLRKVLELSLNVLRFKGDQVVALQYQLENKSQEDDDHSKSDKINEENERLKRIIGKLEKEKDSFKIKNKEVNEENLQLQRRLHELQSSADSDRESSDPLSELDRQEELLKSINTKNKHIKRLLKDIEALQVQNIEQSKTIIDLDKKLQRRRTEISDLQAQLTGHESEKTALKDIISELNAEVSRLEGNVTYLEEERERSEVELKAFITKLEGRAQSWRSIIDEKENQLESLKKKFEATKTDSPSRGLDSDLNQELIRLDDAIKDRDVIIEELESKLKEMAQDMIVSTKLMNKISAEKEEEKKEISRLSRSCCKTMEESLKSAMSRSAELSEMLDKLEEDNALKAKQTMEAVNALETYRKGEDGLHQSLRKIASLEQKLASRDKQIKALVMEVNSFHEISQENTILRKKFNIPEDLVISTTNLKAKERSKDKMIDRLTLKLKASEENRLKLKVEKNEIRTELLSLQKKLSSLHIDTSSGDASLEQKSDGTRTREVVYCDNCLRSMDNVPQKEDVEQSVIREWEAKYESVVEENENLRVGMHEILEKIREYDASSEHITIDCVILDRLLHALDARSINGWYQPVKRDELIAVKSRERIGICDKSTSIDKAETDERAEEEGKHQERSLEISVPKEFESEKVKVEYLKLVEKHRILQIEIDKLKLIEVQFNDLKNHCNQSDNELTKYCSSLVEKLSDLEVRFDKQSKMYTFLKEDYDRSLSDNKNSNQKNISLIADLKKEINDRKQEIHSLKATQKSPSVGQDSEELLELKKSYSKLQTQMAEVISNIFRGKYEFQITEISADFGIINDNLQLDYLTANEFEELKKQIDREQQKANECRLKCDHMEEEMKISNEQIRSLQSAITELTENHIDLRHLVADLQSSSEEKFLIAKYRNNYKNAKKDISLLKDERDKLEEEVRSLKSNLEASIVTIDHLKEKHCSEVENISIKTRYLQKSLFALQQKYFKFTPLVFLSNFVYSYSKFVKKLKGDSQEHEEMVAKFDMSLDKVLEDKRRLTAESGELVKLVKYKTKCQYLENQLKCSQERLISVQLELHEQQLKAAEECEHWKTIQALFSGEEDIAVTKLDVFTQTDTICTVDCGIVTDALSSQQNRNLNRSQQTTPKSSPVHAKSSPKRSSPTGSSVNKAKTDIICVSRSVQSSPIHKQRTDDESLTILSLENQLKQAIQLATLRSSALLDSENKLIEAQGRLKEMENTIDTLKCLVRESNADKSDSVEDTNRQKTSEMIETTISSFQAMLSEKDMTISHYQDLLKAEREQSLKSTENFQKEISSHIKSYTDLEVLIKSKDLEIRDLEARLEKLSSRRSSAEKVEIGAGLDGNGDNSLNEISDKKIEEMFKDSPARIPPLILSRKSSKEENEDTTRYVQQLESQIRDAKNLQTSRENSLRAKDEEVAFLREKLAQYQERERVDVCVNPEIEQLKILLEEKDKHLSDLMETLTSFHDDQQRYINETSDYSADQLSQLGTDLTRSEATNKILQTQVEALRRQLNNLGAREKQSRDLANSLKTQLIKRPVVSIKSELNSRMKNENLQKRVAQLESELENAQEEIKRQRSILDAKRAKSANEVGLWEKQKRWQQTAEKLKLKVEENEASLEKTRSLLNAARTTINRLEKDKHMLETRLSRGNNGPISPSKCCKAPSCPNLLMTKYVPSETPETFTGESTCSSPARGMHYQHGSVELIDALKARIEYQQRKIIAMEMEGKGSNALIVELEKLQEKMSAVEAQNIRLESRNLQLQLENDVLRQGDEGDRLKKRVKHLEDYIIALKEELARIDAQRQLSPAHAGDKKSCQQASADQTILSLKRIVEKLRVENKLLKDRSPDSAKTPTELARVQHLYAEALDKISALQIEMQLKMNQCNKCGINGQDQLNMSTIKEQLEKKTQLLEKAKILLTRAAAKEKVLKEQVVIWKRKCSELQNVPVIEEISE